MPTLCTTSFKHRVFFMILAGFAALHVNAQNVPGLEITNQYNEQKILYNEDSILHTAWKPVVYTDTGIYASWGSWLHRKFFQEHLLQLNHSDFKLNADIIFDEYIGNSKRQITTPEMNTRGYEVSGTVGKNFYFETNFYENQGRFGGYIDSFIRENFIIPGQGGFKNKGDGRGFDFASSDAKLVFKPGKVFLFDLGYGKNFIGDGYRSVLLSDWSFNYPYFRTAVNLGKFQYNVMWSQFIGDRSRYYNNKKGYLRKWAQTFYVDWKPIDQLNIGIFESVMWPDQDSSYKKDMSPWIASPIMFAHGSESPDGVKNNEIYGANIKLRVLKSTHLYGQFALQHSKTGTSSTNEFAIQGGIRSGNTFGVENLNTLLEFNMATPYMYATNTLNTNYAHNNQPLAHALGANFREGLFKADYLYKRISVRLETFYAQYGADSNASQNYGNDIFKPVSTASVDGNGELLQGLKTNIVFADLKLAYVLNPVTNMRIEAGATFRNEKSKAFLYKDRIFYIGIRMSFRKISYDY